MPCQKGSSREAISNNIASMVRSGKPQDQAVAIALKEAGKSRGSGKRKRRREAAVRMSEAEFVDAATRLMALPGDAGEQFRRASTAINWRLQAGGERARRWMELPHFERLSLLAETALSLPIRMGATNPWVIYRGPRGGKGWKHSITGDIRYGGDRPGASETGGDEKAETPSRLHPVVEKHAEGKRAEMTQAQFRSGLNDLLDDPEKYGVSEDDADRLEQVVVAVSRYMSAKKTPKDITAWWGGLKPHEKLDAIDDVWMGGHTDKDAIRKAFNAHYLEATGALESPEAEAAPVEAKEPEKPALSEPSKKPWQMTPDEFIASKASQVGMEPSDVDPEYQTEYRRQHWHAIHQAAVNGERIAPRVLDSLTDEQAEFLRGRTEAVPPNYKRPSERKGEQLTGGKADARPDSDFDADALSKGTAVESEHTDDPEKAKEIAKDHLAEDPKYYDKLAKMEGEAEPEPTAAGPTRVEVRGDIYQKTETGWRNESNPAYNASDEMMQRWRERGIVKEPPAAKETESGVLAETGGKGEGGRLPAGQPVGSPATGVSPTVSTGTGGGTGGGRGGDDAGLRPVADVGRDEATEPADGRGDAEIDSGRAGIAAALPGTELDQPQTADVQAALSKPPTPETPTDLSAGNWRYHTRDFCTGGLKTKFRNNIAALQTLRVMKIEGRDRPTPEEQAVLSKFVGWGQFPGLFARDQQTRMTWEERKKMDEQQLAIDPDFKPREWEKEAKELKALLTPEEWDSARASTKNAHFTHPDIVDAHWAMARKLGYTGGKFLETSAGVGYYLGMMPQDLAARTHSAAVELESSTGAMLQALYPATHTEVQGFQDYQAPPNFYDLIASNVPFGDYGVHDPKYNKYNAKIHDYFFLKSADLAKPGGLVMHITSTGTMDKPDNHGIRAKLAETCDLVAAYRMPGDTHMENAGTAVVTDMIILRKRLPGEKPVDETETPPEAEPKQPGFTGITTDSLGRLYHWKDGKRVPGPNWMDVTDIPDPDGGEALHVNKYWDEHPENVLGRLDRSGTMRASGQKNVSITSPEELSDELGRKVIVEVDEGSGKRRFVFEDDGSKVPNADIRRIGEAAFKKRLQDAIDRLPEGVFKPMQNSKAAFEPEIMPAPGEVKDGGFVVKDGKLFQRTGGALVQVETDSKTIARISGMLAIRDAGRAVNAKEAANEDATDERAELNRLYDEYVEKFGFLHERANEMPMRNDPDTHFIQALEKWNAKTNTATKSDTFSKRTVGSAEEVTSVDNVSDGLSASLHKFGSLDIDYIADKMGVSVADVEFQMVDQGLGYRDPAEGWKPADIYLSGNVRRKLIEATAAAAVDPKYKANVEALLKVQPEDVDYSLITPKMGAPWIPASDISDFATELLEANGHPIMVKYVPETGEWLVKWSKDGERFYKKGPQANQVWGTPDANTLDCIRAALTNKSITIKGGMDEYTDADGVTHQFPAVKYNDEGKEIPITNRKATDDANAKVQEIKEKFKEWIWSDDARTMRLARLYNDNLNNIRDIKYNGQHQKFPGMNPAILPELFPHIKDFVWQVVTTGNGLAGHEVGTGKAQSLDSKILTPTGWVRMGDIHVGDTVIAGDGTPTLVDGVFPQGEKEIFRVVFSDGSSTECCDEHLWLTSTYRERCQAINFKRFAKSDWDCAKPKARSLAEIRKTLVSPHLNAKNHSIPVVGTVQFASRSIPVGAYTMGVLLGDGCLRRQGIAISCSRDDVEIIEAVRSELPDGLIVREQVASSNTRASSGGTKTVSGCPTWAIVMKKLRGYGKDKQPNPLVTAIENLGLTGHRAWEKFIPDEYKFNSPEVRLAVLQGLLDTDGTVSRKGTSVEFYTASERLADDVTFLVRSFGGIVKRGIKHPTYTHSGEKRWGRISYRLTISLPSNIMPFRLQRKVDRVVGKTKYKPTRYIVDVESVGVKPAQCIRVVHPSHLYVTDDFIVTHNTYAMIASAMELRRLGLAKKPCIACLKSNIGQITADCLKLYPNAKILSTALPNGKVVTDTKGRSDIIARMATGDYDIVLMTHDQLDQLKMHPDVQRKYINEELAELTAAIEAAERDDPDGKSMTVKRLEAAKSALEKKLLGLVKAEDKDLAMTFEETGIDQLFVDEAHQYKSLNVITRADRIKGIPTRPSQRATNMLMRTRWLQENHGGRGVVFATGTPINNSMAELFNMQRYLQGNALKERGVHHFDAWVSTFGEIETRQEVSVTGEFKPATRLSKFTNIPEIMHIARQTLDTVRADDLKRINPKTGEEEKVIKRPTRKDSFLKSPHGPAMTNLMASLVKRANALKGRGRAQKGDDNMLVICTDGRKGAVDMRLLDENAPDDPNSKTNQAVRKMLELHKANPDGVQILFSDVGVHEMGKAKKAKEAAHADREIVITAAEDEADTDLESQLDADMLNMLTNGESFSEADLGANGNFRLYQDIIDKLVAGGIPRDQIADFSQLEGKKKEQAMADMRDGKIKVALGSTQRLGTGCNVQNKLMAMHHLDVPWTPAALEQRDGRGWRHGNENKEIGIYRYVAEGSLDQMFWDLVATKAHFQDQILNNRNSNIRTMQDDDSEVLTPEQLTAVASGDPRRLQRVNLMEEVNQLQAAASRHVREQERIKKSIAKVTNELPAMEEKAQKYDTDIKHLESQPKFEFTTPDTPAVEADEWEEIKGSPAVPGKTFTKRDEAEKEFEARLTAAQAEYAKQQERYSYRKWEPIHLGTYRGMNVLYAPPQNLSEAAERRGAYIALEGPSGQKYGANESLGSIEYVVNNFVKKREELQQFIDGNKRQIESAKGKLGKSFPKAKQLEEKRAELDKLNEDMGLKKREEKKPKGVTMSLDRTRLSALCMSLASSDLSYVPGYDDAPFGDDGFSTLTARLLELPGAAGQAMRMAAEAIDWRLQAGGKPARRWQRLPLVRRLSLLVDTARRMPVRPVRMAADSSNPWIAYRGPRGGKGWKHSGTGDIRYGGDRPGAHETGGSGKETPNPFHPSADRHMASAPRESMTQDQFKFVLNQLLEAPEDNGLSEEDADRLNDAVVAIQGHVKKTPAVKQWWHGLKPHEKLDVIGDLMTEGHQGEAAFKAAFVRHHGEATAPQQQPQPVSSTAPKTYSDRTIAAIKGKYHTTAAEQKGIKAGLAAGHRQWKVGRKSYAITEDGENSAVVTVSEKRRGDLGEYIDKQTHVVTFAPAAKPAAETPKPASGEAAGKVEPKSGTILHRFPGEEGTEAVVSKHDKGYAVALRDTDAGETAQGIRIFPTEEAAVKHAQTVNPPKQPATPPKPATDLFGTPVKPESGKADPIESLGGKQQNLFGKKGLPGQQNLFADAGVPESMVQKPQKPAAEQPKGDTPWTGGEIAKGRVYNIPTKDLHIDPERFQFKIKVNREGVTDELKSVRKWNPDFAGVLAVWRDPADNKTYVVNGHHRAELANRLQVPDLPIRYIEAASAKEARGKGALINMAEGRGTAVDAAKYMRDAGATPEDLANEGVSLKGKVAGDATVLCGLSDRAFTNVVRELLPVEKAVAVARHLQSHELQDQLFRLLEKREESGKDLSLRVIEEMAREMEATPTTTKTEKSLFGDIESEESLFVPRNELKSHIRADLSREVRDFMAVASKRRASAVAGSGNVLNVEENKRIADESSRILGIYDTLVNRKGPIADAINEGAAGYAKSKTKGQRDAVRKRTIEAVRKAVFSESGYSPDEGRSVAMGQRRGADATGWSAGVTRPPAANPRRRDSEPAGLARSLAAVCGDEFVAGYD